MGGSAGALDALLQIFPRGGGALEAAVFVVVHSGSKPGALPTIIGRRSGITTVLPADGERIEHGRIYVAPNDCHMILEEGVVRTVRGPRENRVRPAIDPLFRTAARTYGGRVVGVVLSGTLDDGAAGLAEIRRSGGVAVVQDPADALFDGMPRSAIASAGADHVVPAGAIAPLLRELTSGAAVQDISVVESSGDGDPPDAVESPLEAQSEFHQNGRVSVFTCPECSGTLWEVSEAGVIRYRCRVGHAFSRDSLDEAQAASVESALWIAMRALEERAELARRTARRMQEQGLPGSARRFQQRAREADEGRELVRKVLFTTDEPDEETRGVGLG
jgi:two-component system, chemotaxis family, protein-glutamate methylesterase/glutaminase